MTSVSSGPRTMDEIFKDYSARRGGIIRALTFDVDEFYGLCDPGGICNGDSVSSCKQADMETSKAMGWVHEVCSFDEATII